MSPKTKIMQSACWLALPPLVLVVCSCVASSGDWADEGRSGATPMHGAVRVAPLASAESPRSTLSPSAERIQDDAGDAGAPIDDSLELALEHANPLADLISVPIQGDWDTGFGPADADRITVTVQPIVPFSIGRDWNLVTRTAVPIVAPESPATGGREESGLGDVSASAYFTPKTPTASGWNWGVGPAFLFPTASEDELGSEEWAAGPALALSKQRNGWTFGALANHLVSFADEDDGRDVDATYIEPFVSFTTKGYTTWTLNAETTYDWERSQWIVPISGHVSQLIDVAGFPISVGFGYRQFVEAPRGGPDWGLRFVLTPLFPR